MIVLSAPRHLVPSTARSSIWASYFNRDLDKPKSISGERVEGCVELGTALGKKKIRGRTS